MKDAINDVHALTAAAIKLGESQERHRIIGLLEKELSNPLLTTQDLIRKITDSIKDLEGLNE
jgi:hypothetical protein